MNPAIIIPKTEVADSTEFLATDIDLYFFLIQSESANILLMCGSYSLF